MASPQLRYTGRFQCEAPKSYPMHYGSGDQLCWRNCRHCEPCIANRIAEWSLRARLEDGRWEHRAFVTTTYDDAHLPFAKPDPETGELLPSVSRRDSTLFVKRLRRYCAAEGIPRIRIFGSSEYGDLNGRPHDHFAIWGVNGYSRKLRELVERAWSDPRTGQLKGDTRVEGVRESLGAYVAKYALKRLGESELRGREQTKVWYPNRPGLGGDFADVFGHAFTTAEGRRAIAASLHDVSRFRFNGRLTALPSSLKLRARRAAGIDGPEDRYLRKQVHRWRVDEAIGAMGRTAWAEASSHVDGVRIAQARARRKIWESAR